MEFPFSRIVSEERETAEIALEFLSLLKPGDIVCLNGNLGSGKTFFVKTICTSAGIDTAASPSFSIVNEYSGKIKIVHVDFYRIKGLEELYDIGFEEYLLNQDSIIFIEWANMFPEILHKKYYEIEFTMLNQDKREIKILKHG